MAWPGPQSSSDPFQLHGSYASVANLVLSFFLLSLPLNVILSSMRSIFGFCALLLAIAPAIAQKSRPHHRVATPIAKPLSTHECGHDVTLHLSAPEPTQGSLLLLELRSATQPVSEIKATWDDR